MKFTFTGEKYSGEKVSHEFKADFLNEVVFKMDLFLKGVGFQYEGQLEIVKENSNLENVDVWLDSDPYWNSTSCYDSTDSTESTFSAVMNDHMNMLNQYADPMNVDLTGSEAYCKTGCGKCGCGKNAN